jgi:hypothetical protein
MPTENRWRPFDKEDIYPSPGDIDEIRAWAIRLFFADGTERHYTGEQAFWGTGKQARCIAENTAHEFESAGYPVERFETEWLPDE